jgi:hypothetical protein
MALFSPEQANLRLKKLSGNSNKLKYPLQIRIFYRSTNKQSQRTGLMSN